MSNRKNTGWISGTTLPPTKPIRMAAELKALSQKRYGRPATEVEEEFLKLFNEPEEARNNDEAATDAQPENRKGKMGRRTI